MSSKYSLNSKTALFIISGERDNLGEILCINNEVSDLFGFDKTEMIGHSISRLMPPAIGEKHSKFVLNYLKAEVQKELNNVLIYPLHKLGYIIPCCFLLRILPNLRKGLQLIGFLAKLTDLSEFFPSFEKNLDPADTMILLTDDNWKLHSFNIKASAVFGINPSNANLKKYYSSEEKVSVLKFLPELEDYDFLAQAQTPSFANAFINLRMTHKIMEAEVEIVNQNFDQDSINSIGFRSPSNDTYIANLPIDECGR